MLRALRSDDDPAEPAYRVPWRVDRRDPLHPVLRNATSGATDFVRVFIADARSTPEMQLWGQVPPGDELVLCLCSLDPHGTVVTVAWFRPDDGREYLWRFTL